MTNRSRLRIALGTDGVSIWNSEIFGGGDPSRVRAFLARAFAVEEVEDVELRRAVSFGRIRYRVAANPARIWKKLSQAFLAPEDAPPTPGVRREAVPNIDAGLVYLDAPGVRPIQVNRIGRVLSTWRVHRQSETALRISHPLLRNRRDVVFRLEEELTTIVGVEDFRASAVTARVSIRFDERATTAERIARELEKAWPRLLDGLDGPPSRTRLIVAVGLAGLGYTGQYLVPALRPFAVGGYTLYSWPNVVGAAKQLARGEVGLPALYTTGLTFLFISGMPFTASLMAAFMQMWPHLARRKLVISQRRLFAGQHRLPRWARIAGAEGVEVGVDDLVKGDVVVVRSGETIPVDGVVEGGAAAVVPAALFGGAQVEDRSSGDSVEAGAFVRDGSLTIRVERAGAQTSAGTLASLLPHGAIAGLPSSAEAERIARRNVKPTLALSALALLATRALLPAQPIIRPDYATGPRIGAQLSVLRGMADGLQRGVVFKNPAALDGIAAPDTFVIDASAGLDRRRAQIAKVEAVSAVSPDLVVSYALAAYPRSRTELSLALSAFATKRKIAAFDATSIERRAGLTRYRDRSGTAIEIVTTPGLAASPIEFPKRFHTVLERRGRAQHRHTEGDAPQEAGSLRPLFVLRDGAVIGVVSFARTGEVVGRQVVAALTAHHPAARIVYVSRDGDARARALARTLGIEFSDESPTTSAEVDRVGGPRGTTMWVGDGSDPRARDSIGVSAVRVSVAPLSRSSEDAADILLPHKGIAGLAELLAVGRAHSARVASDYRTVYSANLFGVGGALLASLSALQVGLLSNIGTGVIYLRHARALDRLASAAERKRTRLKKSVLPLAT
jgi:manganese/zinc-transporting P-type ATPase C